MSAKGDESIGDVTVLLRAIQGGRPGATEAFMKRVLDELHQIACNRVSSAGGDALEPTALVNEAYLRLFGRESVAWENRHHFFWAAARAMRDILVEKARRQTAAKRGGGHQRVPLYEPASPEPEVVDVLSLNEAVHKLEAEHPLAAQIVMLRFFGGLTREQTAEVTGLSPAAVWREWNFAKAWLHAELNGREPGAGRSST